MKMMTDQEKAWHMERGKALTEGVLYVLSKWFVIGLFIVAAVAVTAEYFRWGYDGTDSRELGRRSGMRLHTDYGTGCQYLESASGGLTVRVLPNGEAYCNPQGGKQLLTDAELESIYSEAKPFKPNN